MESENSDAGHLGYLLTFLGDVQYIPMMTRPSTGRYSSARAMSFLPGEDRRLSDWMRSKVKLGQLNPIISPGRNITGSLLQSAPYAYLAGHYQLGPVPTEMHVCVFE